MHSRMDREYQFENTAQQDSHAVTRSCSAQMWHWLTCPESRPAYFLGLSRAFILGGGSAANVGLLVSRWSYTNSRN